MLKKINGKFSNFLENTLRLSITRLNMCAQQWKHTGNIDGGGNVTLVL